MAIPLNLTKSAKEQLIEFLKNEKNVDPRKVDEIIAYCREHADKKEEEIRVSENLVEEAYEELVKT